MINYEKCPFCGSEPHVYSDDWGTIIGCTNPNCELSYDKQFRVLQTAKDWNSISKIINDLKEQNDLLYQVILDERAKNEQNLKLFKKSQKYIIAALQIENSAPPETTLRNKQAIIRNRCLLKAEEYRQKAKNLLK